MYKHYSKSKVFSVLDQSTGEVETTEFIEKVQYKPNGKQGWTKMYRAEYDEIMLSLSSKLEMQMFIYIRDSFTRTNELAVFNQTNNAEKFQKTNTFAPGY